MKICAIRQKMQHFINMLDQYLYAEIIDKAWTQFENKIKSSQNYSELLESHCEYLSRIMEKCFLLKNSVKIHQQLIEMFKLIFSFQIAVIYYILIIKIDCDARGKSNFSRGRF